eukprot:8216885-Pyramimonas_sp.AAC.2
MTPGEIAGAVARKKAQLDAENKAKAESDKSIATEQYKKDMGEAQLKSEVGARSKLNPPHAYSTTMYA